MGRLGALPPAKSMLALKLKPAGGWLAGPAAAAAAPGMMFGRR